MGKAVSPSITSIRRLSGTDKEIAISDLLRKGYKEGFPLVERDSLFMDDSYVTFIYIDTLHTNSIEFEVFGIYDETRFMEKKLYRLDSTDIYYNTYLMPDDICFSYRYILNDTVTGEKSFITDPLNKNLIPTGEIKAFSWSVLDLREDEANWYTKRSDEVSSKLDTFRITSNILNNTRNIYVYLPPGYDEKSGKRYSVIYLFDSFIYLHRIEVPNVLDNLINENKIEPMVAVFIDNPTNTSRKYELPLNPLFKDFVVQELMPIINNKYRITEKQAETIIGGMSYGGLAAAYIAFECDSVFGKVLSQSGSFWRDLKLTDIHGFEYIGDWLINKYLVEDHKDLRIFLDWGLQENWCLSSGRKMVKALDKKGYDYKFVEFNGWHDWSNSRKTFPEGLLYLLRH